MSECTCPCPTCDDEHSATLMELDEARHMQRSLECELSATRIALDAAEDEIEKLISEKETLRAERDMLKRGGEQLGKIIDRQGRDVIELTDSQDIIGEDGDGDWEVVWERLHDMKRERDQLGAALKFAAPIAYRMIIGGGS